MSSNNNGKECCNMFSYIGKQLKSVLDLWLVEQELVQKCNSLVVGQ